MTSKQKDFTVNNRVNLGDKINLEHVKSLISSEHYFTAAQGYEKSAADNFHDDPYPLATPMALEHLTFCVLVLKNGSTVTGESAHASNDGFDFDIDCSIAYDNAVSKIWALEAYLMKQRLSEE